MTALRLLFFSLLLIYLSPSEQAEEGVSNGEAFCEDVLTVTVQKAARSNYKANLSAAATLMTSDEGTRLLLRGLAIWGRLFWVLF